MALVQDRKCVKPVFSDARCNIIDKQRSLIELYQSIYYNSNNEQIDWDESKLPYLPNNGNSKDFIQHFNKLIQSIKNNGYNQKYPIELWPKDRLGFFATIDKNYFYD